MMKSLVSLAAVTLALLSPQPAHALKREICYDYFNNRPVRSAECINICYARCFQQGDACVAANIATAEYCKTTEDNCIDGCDENYGPIDEIT